MKQLKLETFLAVTLILVLIIKNAASFLVINEPPQKADVIIVLSGDKGRLQRGIELYRQGYAPYLLYTSSKTDLEESKAVAEGVPRDAFIPDRQAQNTYQNAERSKALMEQYGFRSAIVVSSDYHMRRASLIFAHVFRGTDMIFTYVSVKDPDFHLTRWWTSRQTMLHMAWEYMGMAAFYMGLGHYITDAWVEHSPFWYLFRYMH